MSAQPDERMTSGVPPHEEGSDSRDTSRAESLGDDMGLADLPDELLEAVARHLDDENLQTWRFVCKQFARVGSSLIDTLTFELSWSQREHHCESMLLDARRAFSHASSLKVYYYNLAFTDHPVLESPRFFHLLAKGWPRLKSFEMEGALSAWERKREVAYPGIGHMTQLERLVLSELPNLHAFHAMLAPLGRLRHIWIMDKEGSGMPARHVSLLRMHVPQLETLGVVRMAEGSAPVLHEMAELTALTRLELRSDTQAGVEDFDGGWDGGGGGGVAGGVGGDGNALDLPPPYGHYRRRFKLPLSALVALGCLPSLQRLDFSSVHCHSPQYAFDEGDAGGGAGGGGSGGHSGRNSSGGVVLPPGLFPSLRVLRSNNIGDLAWVRQLTQLQELHLHLTQSGAWSGGMHSSLSSLPASCSVHLNVVFGGEVVVSQLVGLNLVSLSLDGDTAVRPSVYDVSSLTTLTRLHMACYSPYYTQELSPEEWLAPLVNLKDVSLPRFAITDCSKARPYELSTFVRVLSSLRAGAKAYAEEVVDISTNMRVMCRWRPGNRAALAANGAVEELLAWLKPELFDLEPLAQPADGMESALMDPAAEQQLIAMLQQHHQHHHQQQQHQQEPALQQPWADAGVLRVFASVGAALRELGRDPNCAAKVVQCGGVAAIRRLQGCLEDAHVQQILWEALELVDTSDTQKLRLE